MLCKTPPVLASISCSAGARVGQGRAGCIAPQVGADEKLSSVIDGESLVNDGSALVIFLVLQQFVQGASLMPTEVRVRESVRVLLSRFWSFTVCPKPADPGWHVGLAVWHV